jgi:hypothetical protein
MKRRREVAAFVRCSASNRSSLGAVQFSPQKVSILNRRSPIDHPPAFKNHTIKNSKTKAVNVAKSRFSVIKTKAGMNLESSVNIFGQILSAFNKKLFSVSWL